MPVLSGLYWLVLELALPPCSLPSVPAVEVPFLIPGSVFRAMPGVKLEVAR